MDKSPWRIVLIQILPSFVCANPEQLSAKEGDEERYDYVFVTPKTSPKQLKKSVEDYMNIGKLIEVN